MGVNAVHSCALSLSEGRPPPRLVLVFSYRQIENTFDILSCPVLDSSVNGKHPSEMRNRCAVVREKFVRIGVEPQIDLDLLLPHLQAALERLRGGGTALVQLQEVLLASLLA